MRLYLVQHGLAKDESEDALRPLSGQGRREAEVCADFLARSGERPQPVRILHSGKLRARQTAEIFAVAWGGIPVAQALDLAPKDDPSAWSAHLASMRDDVMLVGHLPHLQRLAGLLLCRDPACAVVHFQNAGVLCLEESDSGWSVLWHINPKQLCSH